MSVGRGSDSLAISTKLRRDGGFNAPRVVKLRTDADAASIKACPHKAIEVARSQSAKSLELRAVMSLGRLLAKQGQRQEARVMLTDIYGWFTEGFDTADLMDAKTLLDELNA
jgi:hypothetical protein